MAKYQPRSSRNESVNNNRRLSEESFENDSVNYDQGEYHDSAYSDSIYENREISGSRRSAFDDDQRVRRSPGDSERGYAQNGRRATAPPKKKKKHVWVYILLAVLVVLIVAVVIFATKARAEVNELKGYAYELKDDLSTTVEDVRAFDPDKAEDDMEKVREASEKISAKLNEPFWNLASRVPVYGADVNTVKELLTVLDEADKGIVTPFIEQMREYPFENLKVDGGLDVSVVLSYLDFLEETEPEIKNVADNISNIKFNMIDMDLGEYAEKFTSLFASLSSMNDYKDLLRTILGNGNDRHYLVMAQNTAEIRASGGFPGSMGTITIEDGILSIGGFSSINNFIYKPILPEAGITEREAELFQYMYANWAQDACYNPHFAKVAHITKTAYEYANGITLDGVISLTPEIIQEILKLSGESMELDDGTKLDGTNATKVIERDLYIKYQGNEATAWENNDYIDGLFSETATRAVSLLFSGLDLDRFPDYISLFENGCARNTIMLWFADKDEEEVSIKAGCSGNLNSDPENPFTGVYFSCCDPGRLGMFTEIDTEVSEPVKNSKGENEYTVTVKLNNYINEENIEGVNSHYILGNNGGAIQSYVYFFAPAGGTVSDFKTSNGMEISMSEYEDLQLGYVLNLMLHPDDPIVITYKATTAEGVETPLGVKSTPTLQDYR